VEIAEGVDQMFTGFSWQDLPGQGSALFFSEIGHTCLSFKRVKSKGKKKFKHVNNRTVGSLIF